jgi:hypothetical protein
MDRIRARYPLPHAPAARARRCDGSAWMCTTLPFDRNLLDVVRDEQLIDGDPNARIQRCSTTSWTPSFPGFSTIAEARTSRMLSARRQSAVPRPLCGPPAVDVACGGSGPSSFEQAANSVASASGIAAATMMIRRKSMRLTQNPEAALILYVQVGTAILALDATVRGARRQYS